MSITNNEQEWQEHLDKLMLEADMLNEEELRKRIYLRKEKEDRAYAERSKPVVYVEDEEQKQLGEWWISLPLFKWNEAKTLDPLKFKENNAHRLFFDCIIKTDCIRYYRARDKRLSADNYATFVRCAHLMKLFLVNTPLAVQELKRMADVDSRVIMEDTTKLEHNLIKMIDFIAHGYLYSRSDKSDKKQYQNKYGYCGFNSEIKLDGPVVSNVRMRVLSLLQDMLVDCKINRVILKKKENRGNATQLF